MPHTKSAKKRLRQSEARRLRNRAAKRIIRDETKKALTSADKGEVEALSAQYRVVASKLDKAGQKRLLHPNAVARKKSQLARLLNSKKKDASA